MAVLFISILPLPNKVRKGIFNSYYRLTSSQQSLTVIIILGVLVGLLFADSWKRAQIPVTLYRHKHYENGIEDPNPVTSIQVLATRAYNQRNCYISGFILYFLVCIPTVMSILRRLVKYKDLIIQQEKGLSGDVKVSSDVVTTKEVETLKNLLHEKKTSLEGVKRQVKNLEKYFDEMNKSPNKESVNTKKSE